MKFTEKKLKGEVTVFLSLLLIFVIMFLVALIESSTIAVAKSYARGEADLAIESVFAEYRQELLKEFGIFAIEGTYETGNYYVENLTHRLIFYGSASSEWEVTQLQLLSDANGAAFEEQIVTYMSQKYGLSQLNNLGIDDDTWTSQRVDGEEYTSDFEVSMSTLIEEEDIDGSSLDIDGTILESLLDLQDSSVLELVTPNGKTISENTVTSSNLASNRNLNVGISSYQLDDSNNAYSKWLVSEYALEFYDSALDSLGTTMISEANESATPENESDQGLQYELEYIIVGNDSDQENLSDVVNKIVLMRMGTNYTCLLQSMSKQAEVNALALTLATACMIPELEPAIAQALLLGWAYGESIIDVRSLLAGKHVELIKSELDWQLSLTGLMALGTEEDSYEGTDISTGLGYEDYLRILIYLEEKDSVVLKSLDMLEQRMQIEKGLSYFRVDCCVTQLELLCTSEVTGGYTYEFPVKFTYR